MKRNKSKRIAAEAIFYDEVHNVFMTIDHREGTVNYNGKVAFYKFTISSSDDFYRIEKCLSKIGIKYINSSNF